MPFKYCHHSTVIKPTNLQLFAANDAPIDVLGVATVHFTIDGMHFQTDALGTENFDEFLISYAFLSENLSVWDFGRNVLRVVM